MRSLKRLGLTFAMLGLSTAAALSLRHSPAVAQNAPRQPAGRNGGEAPVGVGLRRYGPLLIRPVTISAVVKDTGRDDFNLVIHYDAPRDEVHATLLSDPTGAKQLWADLTDMAARDPRSGLKQVGELAFVRADNIVAAWGEAQPGVQNDVTSIHLDIGAPEPVSITADDQAFTRDQVRACWQSLASLAPAAANP